MDIEPSLNHLAAARPALAETAGYYYGLAHFIITRLVLAWLWLRRPAAFGPLRSALVLATTGANLVFWTWPVAPPRFAVPGMTDVLVRYRILGAGDAHGPDSLVNLYASMPSLHVAWAAWCAAAIVAATRGRWRHLAWLYPAATTVVVLATANHFLADAAAGLAITALGLLAARATTRPDATEPGPGGAVPAAAPPALGPGAATRHRRPVIWWRRLARRWALAVTGAAAVLVQQLGRRGAGRPGGRQPGRRRATVAGPPLSTRTVRVLTGGQDPHLGPPYGLAPCAHTSGRPAVQEHVMSLSHHQQHQLHRIETGLLRGEPQLAAMLGVFGLLFAGYGRKATIGM